MQLDRLEIDCRKDLKAVIMTHMHHDHAGGLHHFPHNRILVPREGWRFADGLKGKLAARLPQRWPVWLRPELLDLNGPAVGPFPAPFPSQPISESFSYQHRAISLATYQSSLEMTI